MSTRKIRNYEKSFKKSLSAYKNKKLKLKPESIKQERDPIS